MLATEARHFQVDVAPDHLRRDEAHDDVGVETCVSPHLTRTATFAQA
jgi:hypothetical protein